MSSASSSVHSSVRDRIAVYIRDLAVNGPSSVVAAKINLVGILRNQLQLSDSEIEGVMAQVFTLWLAEMREEAHALNLAQDVIDRNWSFPSMRVT